MTIKSLRQILFGPVRSPSNYVALNKNLCAERPDPFTIWSNWPSSWEILDRSGHRCVEFWKLFCPCDVCVRLCVISTASKRPAVQIQWTSWLNWAQCIESWMLHMHCSCTIMTFIALWWCWIAPFGHSQKCVFRMLSVDTPAQNHNHSQFQQE